MMVGHKPKGRVRAIILMLVLCGATLDELSAASTWRMVRSSDQIGVTHPALMQVADFDRSDSGIAGVMERCDHASLETILIVLDPLPPRSTATVSLTVATDIRSFEATTIPTGAGLRIPFDPRTILATTWLGQKDLRVDIVYPDHSAHAMFDLTGLQDGLSNLLEECANDR